MNKINQMAIEKVDTHASMLANLDKKQKNYVLLYKGGSEVSDCSRDSIRHASAEMPEINILFADVNLVRDIHANYSVNSVPALLVFEGKKFVKVIKGCHDDQYYRSLFESAIYTSKTAAGDQPQKRVVVYSTPSCSWCTTLKTHLKKNGIRYREIDVSKDEKAASEMVKKSGQQGVPQTDIGGKMIIGFDKNRINTLLGIN